MKKIIGFIILLVLVICGSYWIAINSNKQTSTTNKIKSNVTKDKNDIINKQKIEPQENKPTTTQTNQTSGTKVEQQRQRATVNKTPKPIEALNNIVGTYTGSNGTLNVTSTYFSLGVADNEIQVNSCNQNGNTFNISGENPPYAGNNFTPTYFNGTITKNSNNTLSVTGFGPCDGIYQKIS